MIGHKKILVSVIDITHDPTGVKAIEHLIIHIDRLSILLPDTGAKTRPLSKFLFFRDYKVIGNNYFPADLVIICSGSFEVPVLRHGIYLQKKPVLCTLRLFQMIVAASADKELLLQFPGSVKNHAGDLRFTEAIVPLFFFIFSEEVISAFLLDAEVKCADRDRIQPGVEYDIPFCITLDDPGVISCLDLIHAGNVVGVISLCEDEAAILCCRERRRAICIIFSFSGILRQNLSIEIHHRDRKCIGIFPFGIFFQLQKSVRKCLHMAESVFRDDLFKFRGHRPYLSDRLRRACIFRFYRYSGGIRLSSAG